MGHLEGLPTVRHITLHLYPFHYIVIIYVQCFWVFVWGESVQNAPPPLAPTKCTTLSSSSWMLHKGAGLSFHLHMQFQCICLGVCPEWFMKWHIKLQYYKLSIVADFKMTHLSRDREQKLNDNWHYLIRHIKHLQRVALLMYTKKLINSLEFNKLKVKYCIRHSLVLST